MPTLLFSAHATRRHSAQISVTLCARYAAPNVDPTNELPKPQLDARQMNAIFEQRDLDMLEGCYQSGYRAWGAKLPRKPAFAKGSEA
jgi:hypothetical protein